MLAEHNWEKLATSNPPAALILLPAFVLLAVVIVADFQTGYELSLSTLYVLLVLPVSWFCGLWWGILFAVLSAAAQFQIRLLLGNNFSEPVYFYISNGNKVFSYLIIAFLASTAHRLYIRASTAARMDYLTGLVNNLGFYERLTGELARHRRNKYCFSVAYIDCDHFKVINDALGHAEGDRVLAAVGQVLKSNSRKSDIGGRLGGDEFAIIFPETGETQVVTVVDKLRSQLDAAMGAHEWPITFSIGVGVFPIPPDNSDQVIAFADKLMYRVKTAGKNKIIREVYNPL